ncbi:tropomyosin beta chain-like [Palaemon carinicauda]|uniref:tropomyosin beta chain-like n=1 Tax=Palaemon carinicauda TaxID=392227 RepID=UPI0035B58F57
MAVIFLPVSIVSKNIVYMLLFFGRIYASYAKEQSSSRKAEEEHLKLVKDVDVRNQELLKEIAESKEKEVALQQRIQQLETQLEKKIITHSEDEKSIRGDSGRIVRMAIEQKNKKKDDENYERSLEFQQELKHHKRNVLLEEELEKTQQKLAIARKQLELSRNWIGVLKEEIAELDQKQEVRSPQLCEETTRRLESLERKLLEKNGQMEALQATINSQGLQIENNQTVINQLLEMMKNVDFRQVLLDEKEERLRQREAKLKSREAKHWGLESKRADSGNQRRRQWELDYHEFLVKSRQYALDNAFYYHDYGSFWFPVWIPPYSPLDASEYFERLSHKVLNVKQTG